MQLYGENNWVNIGSVDGLLSDGTKSVIAWTNIDLSSVRFRAEDGFTKETSAINQ